MSKYQQRKSTEEIEAERIVAEMLPALREQVTALIASWGTEFPEMSDRVMSQTILRPAIEARFPESTTFSRYVKDLLHAELEKPLNAARRAVQIAARKATEAAVDTDRPCVATTVESSRPQIGSLSIVTSRTETSQVLVCIRADYNPGAYEYERPSGWYCNYAEPNADEMQSAEYQRLTAKIAADATAERAAYAAAHRDTRGESEASADELFDDLLGHPHA